MCKNKTKTSEYIDIALSDVNAQDEVIAKINNVVMLNKNKALADYWKTTQLKGMLFAGPSGVGKKKIARGLVNELANNTVLKELIYSDVASCWYVCPIEKIKEFFDIVEKKVREKHIIIFIDENDSFLSNREQIHDASIKMVNELLAWLYGGLFTIKCYTSWSC